MKVLEIQKIADIYNEILEFWVAGNISIYRYPEKPDLIPRDDQDLVNLAATLDKDFGAGITDYCIKLLPHLEERLKGKR